MRVLLLTGLLAIPASASSVPAASVSRIPVPMGGESVINPNPLVASGHCPATPAQMAADRARKNGGRALFRKLTELPPGDMYSAVYRRDANGCESPIVVKYGIDRR